MLRRSVPASSRWEANECRSTCGLRGFLMPNCSRSFWQTTRTVFAFSCCPVRLPGKSQSLGLRPRQYARRISSSFADSITWRGNFTLAFANVNDHPLAVDVGHLQIQRFLTAQAGAVVQGKQRPVLDVHLCIEQGTDFLPAPDGGQLAPHLGLDDFLIEPGLLQCSRIEELQRRPGPLDRSPGKLPFVEQMEKKRSNMFGTELIR